MVRKIVLSALVLFISAPVALILIEHYRGQRMLAQTLADLSARGEVFDITKIAPAPVPADSNALDSFLSAAAGLKMENELTPPALQVVAPGRAVAGTRLESWPGSGGTPHSWTEVEEWQQRHQADFGALHESLQSPYRLPVLDYSAGFQVLLPHLAQMKGAVMALGVSASVAAHRRDFDGALTNFKAMHQVEHDMAGQPLLIDQLVRVALAAIANSRGWDILNAQPWTESQLDSLQSALPSAELAGGIARSLEGERALVLVTMKKNSPKEIMEMLQVPGTGGTPPSSTGQMLLQGLGAEAAKLWFFAWGDQALTHYLRSMQTLLEANRDAAKSRSFQRLQKFDADSLTRGGFLQARMVSLYTRNILPALEKAAGKALRCETERSLLATGIALRRYQIHNGRLPSQLTQLVPEFLDQVPIDRMDGQPLRYRLEPDGTFRLWSIGEDMVDNDGDATHPDSAGKSQQWWTARDAVWPQEASDEEVASWRQQEAERLDRGRKRKSASNPPTANTMSPELLKRYGLTPAMVPGAPTNAPAPK